MNKTASILVNQLLEDEVGITRACAHCEQELKKKGIQPQYATKNVSHGICRRHAEAVGAELREPAKSKYADRLKKASDSDFCPDTGKLW